MTEHDSCFRNSNSLRALAHKLIPGGAHTYAKGDDQYPILSPGFIVRGRGCHVWDVDGNRYIEYGMGVRAVTLGHAHPSVIEAAAAALKSGSNFTRPSPIEVECAERLLEFIPGADMAKFCKDSSTATSAAVKLARAYTGRDLIAICADHPFFSYFDWFMASTPVSAGVYTEERNATVKFRYNDIASVEALFAAHPGKIACLMMEPARIDDPIDGFLENVQKLCQKNGALLVFDEVCTGFRWHNGGGQAYYGVVPDLSCFGKAMANGFSVSALVGKREYMRLGGLEHTDRQRVFLLSSTHGAETHALAAANETMRIYRDEPVVDTLYRQGRRLRAGICEAITRQGLRDYVQIVGNPTALFFVARDARGEVSASFRTLLMQEIIRRGVLAPSLVVSYAHTDDDIDATIEAFNGAFQIYQRALSEGHERYLVGRPVETVYRPFNSPQSASGDRKGGA